MGLFDLFKNKAKVEVPEEVEETQEQEGIEVYSGIRVEVTTIEDQLLFTAKLMDLKGDTGELSIMRERKMTAAIIPMAAGPLEEGSDDCLGVWPAGAWWIW